MYDDSGANDVVVIVSPGPLGVLLCRNIPDRAVVQGFEPLPSGVMGAVEEDGRVEHGFSIVGVNAVDTSNMTLVQVQEALRVSDLQRVRFRPGPVTDVLQDAIAAHRRQMQYNVYARVSLRTKFFRTWKRAFHVFEVPHALSIYRQRDDHEQRVDRQQQLEMSNVKCVVILNGAQGESPCRVGPLGLRTYRVGGQELQLYKFRLEQQSKRRSSLSMLTGSGSEPGWNTIAKLGHPSEAIARSLRSKIVAGGAREQILGRQENNDTAGGAARTPAAPPHRPRGFGGFGSSADPDGRAGSSPDSRVVGGGAVDSGVDGGGGRDGGASDSAEAVDIAQKYAAWGTIDLSSGRDDG